MELDRAELQDSVRRVFEDTGVGPDRDKSWTLAVEMGWLALGAPEDLGGLEQGRAALCTLHNELGRALASGAVLPAMLAVEAVSKAQGFEGQAAWIERLVGGERVTASLAPAPLSAKADGEGFALTGLLAAVQDADQASHVLVWADDVVGLLPLDAAGVSVAARKAWDPGRQLFEVRLDGAKLPAELVLARGDKAPGLAGELETQLLYALASDSLGAAAAAFEMTVEYLQTRRQFARPLAMFQALKHRCADLKALLATAEALLWQSADGRPALGLDALTQAGALKSHADMVAHAIAEETIQLHGGIGLTAEHPSHLFVKRLLLNESLGGHADRWEQAAGAQAIKALARA
jgi:alkylation response protein AidB-like acyl-CoA dehydrogenase